MFTTQHYEAVADSLKTAIEEVAEDTHYGKDAALAVGYVLRHLSDMFTDDNERFKRQLFLDRAQGRFELNTEERCSRKTS